MDLLQRIDVKALALHSLIIHCVGVAWLLPAVHQHALRCIAVCMLPTLGSTHVGMQRCNATHPQMFENNRAYAHVATGLHVVLNHEQTCIKISFYVGTHGCSTYLISTRDYVHPSKVSQALDVKLAQMYQDGRKKVYVGIH